MQVQAQVSRNIIDRRKHVASGAIAGILATLLGLLGIRLASSEPDPEIDLVYVVSTALDRGQAYWQDRIKDYRPAKVVLFSGSTATACGLGLAESGPFFCEGDGHIFLDLGFLRAIEGDLARAYVIYHELGHHVQKLRGIGWHSAGFTFELQADCLAGAVIRDEQIGGRLVEGDIEQALAAVAAIGDDRIRPGSSPETWTHGSADMRVDAVRTGLEGHPCP